MDTEDTQDASKADAAAVKRKRRSSILKNQRPPRTPFSEVEFNVATPPDTTKSRRVSFSRRTGVAEFVTNEATTTWRNFYEEHNKSLESSGNENNLVENAPRQTIEHIGKRMFDQQFEEVEAFDLGGTIHANPLQQFQASFNKINLTQELASLECMNDDLKFVPSQSKFEQSALTELSKPFGNDMQCPVMEDMTNPLSMNFSTMQPMSSSKCDDLDEIQNDLERSKPSAMCPGPMNPGKDFSGYIEVADLDVTHGAIHNDCSEMSITDTIGSPKVQDAAKNSVQQSKSKVDDDWINDKENMVFNPYVAPKESLTFAVNKASDEVLVFDGKRLTTQSVTSNICENKENFRQTLPNAPQRKTIILDVDDDLPNFIDNNSSKASFNLHVTSKSTENFAINVQNKTNTASNKSMANDTIDMGDTSNLLSFTQAISSNIIAAKRESVNVKHCNMVQDISITQAVPNNIVQINKENMLQTDNNEKRRTIIFAGESNDISMTQALPTNINVNIANDDQGHLKNKTEQDASSQKRKTIIFNEDSCNISITQAGPVNIIDNQINNGAMSGKNCNGEKRRTIIFDHESCDISMTQALPTNININKENEKINYNIFDDNVTGNKPSEKRNTIIFDKESCDISMTQALPTNMNFIENAQINNEINKIIVNNNCSEKRRTIIFDKESCDISVTQAVPTNIDLIENLQINNEISRNIVKGPEKRRTIIFDKDSCDISMTQALPTNINLLENLEKRNEVNDLPVSNENSEKRRTILFDKDSCDISMTQALPTNINVLENLKGTNKASNEIVPNENFEKRRTIIFDRESCDISVTQAVPTNIDLIENFDRSHEFNKVEANNENLQKRRTIIFDKDSCNMSVTQAIPSNIDIKENIEKNNKDVNETPEKHKTIIFDNISCDISMTQALPAKLNIFNETTSKGHDDDVKLDLDNHRAIVTDEFISKMKSGSSNKSEIKENKDVSLIETTQKRKTISSLDNSYKYSDQNVIEPLKVEKINKTYNNDIEDTDFCKTVQPNLIHEENKELKSYVSLSSSGNQTHPDPKQISYSRFNQSKMEVENYGDEKYDNDDGNKSLLSKIYVKMDNVKEELSNLNKEDSMKTLETKHDPTMEYLTYEPEFKTNVSVYNVDTNKQMNKTTTDNSNADIVARLDKEKATKLFEDNIMNDNLQKNKSKCNEPRPKKSILDELLNMSSDSVNDQNEDIIHGSVVVNEDSSVTPTVKQEICQETSIAEIKTKSNETRSAVEIKSNDSVMLMDNQTNENHFNESNNQESVARFKNNLEVKSEDPSKCNMDLDESVKFITDLDSPKTFKSVKEADNTKDLLKMLTDITDEDDEETTFKPENGIVQDHEKPPISEKNSIATKGTLQEPKRLSLAPRRQSIAISREDLLNNISMAKAALQQSRFEVDETDIMDDTSELIETHEINDSYKSNRMSTEVVKTLQFEDESASDASIKTDIKMSPLRKSVVDEITCVNDKKVNVIPTFLTDVSAPMKDLINDLVKPNADDPLENNFTEINAPSTCNAEVETNFISSSQIDVSHEGTNQCLLKKSVNCISKIETKSVGLEVDTENVLHDIKATIIDDELISTVQKSTDENLKKHNITEDIVKCNIHDVIKSSPEKSKHENIVFNSDNPLKNVVLPPIDYSDTHKYNQFQEEKEEKKEDAKRKSRHSSYKNKESDEKSLGNRSYYADDAFKDQKITEHMKIVCGQTISERSDDNVRKPVYTDKSVDSVAPALKDTEVNTVIVMKENRDLMQSSSLTITGDRITDSEFKMNIDSSSEPSSENIARSYISPVKILFQNENDSKFAEKDADTTSSEELNNVDFDGKARKRSYSPTSANSCVLPNVEVTPKPISKMQKMSNSPLTKSTDIRVDDNIMQVDLEEDEIKSLKYESKVKSTTHTEIVQNLEVKYDNCIKLKSKHTPISQNTKLEDEKTSEKESKRLRFSSESVLQDPSVVISEVVTNITSRIVTSLEDEKEDRIEKDCGPNVIDDIKQLSFMGTWECEWERCGRAGAWSFRLLCGRVRVCVQPARPGAVAADTPVTVDVEVASADEKDAIACLCTQLAAEAMRHEAACAACAGAVAALLRRCVRVARLARRWARAMRDAHARLAYRVLPDGYISLKVANLPLRRVVEVRLHVALAVGRERGAAYPCADRLALAGAGTGAGAGAGAGAGPDLARLADQPQDWGHVPRTIWKVFKYLKSRARTEDLLGN